ncbi:Gfo/Idh/MocA family protein [Solidesulfovibrio alcoholivorans]|uniref:Gfo/Idh/MocA family protein n=1 Tax=Solidesulfovibrio alcoholivorans TaxID=81406 RepID=UPI000497CD11|nr:Gfo/Idh/MocA family oxidoreductase [Solidesulfovibrio alcoholivorans]
MDDGRTFSALLVGLGRIGFLYDADGAPDLVLTHARALLRQPSLRLLGGVDPAPDRRARFAAATGLPAFAAIPAALPGPPDLVVLATPPEGRPEQVRQCLELSPRLLLVEKPLATDADAGREMVAACRARGVTLCVNYHRRCEPAVARIRELLAGGGLGPLLAGRLAYSGGLAHNAAHFVDLLRLLFGEPDACGVLPRPGRAAADPDAVDFFLEFSGAACVCQALTGADYAHADLELLFAGGAVRYADFGRAVSFHPAGPDPHFPDCRALAAGRSLVAPGEYEQGQSHVAAHIARVLAGLEAPVSDGDSALATLDLCRELARRWTFPA